MAFTPVHGSRGRITAIFVTPDLTLPVPTLTGLTQAPVNGITKWRLNLEAQAGDQIHHFEGTTSAAGIIQGEEIQGGVGTHTVDIEGYFDLAATVGTEIQWRPGVFVVMDLIYNRATGLTGHSNVYGKVMTLSMGPGVKDGPVTFAAKVRVHSTVADAGTTTTAT